MPFLKQNRNMNFTVKKSDKFFCRAGELYQLAEDGLDRPVWPTGNHGDWLEHTAYPRLDSQIDYEKAIQILVSYGFVVEKI